MNDRNSSQKQNISGLMVLLLFGVFAVCILSVLLSGARVYDRLTARDERAYNARTTAQYLSTRLRQAQNADALELSFTDGGAVLHLYERYGTDLYETRLFCRDGWLCEQYLTADADVDDESGERILPADAIDGSVENGLLTLHVTDPGGTQTVRILLRGGEVRP